MLKRHLTLRKHVTMINTDELSELPPPPEMDCRLILRARKLRAVKKVVSLLPDSTCTLYQMRICSDSVLDRCDTIFACLHTNSGIELKTTFEPGPNKIQKTQTGDPISTKKRTMRDLQIDSDCKDAEVASFMLIVQRALKCVKADQQSTCSEYTDTKHLLSTSDNCKRLFQNESTRRQYVGVAFSHQILSNIYLCT